MNHINTAKDIILVQQEQKQCKDIIASRELPKDHIFSN